MAKAWKLNPKRISSYFDGKCRTCGKALPKGSICWFAKHYGARCEECGPHTPDLEPLPVKEKKARTPLPVPAKRSSGFQPSDEAPDFNAGACAAVRGEDGIHRIEFGSIREIIEDALSDYAQNDHNRERLRSLLADCLSGESKWANHYTREKLVENVFSPPAHLIGAIDKMREHLAGEVELPLKPRRKLRRGLDWGDTLDADRWLARDPSPWERIERKAEVRRLVRIGCNLAVSWKVKPLQLLYRGAAALALADHLTRKGCSVGVTLYKAVGEATSQVKRGLVKCEIKRPDMPMDLPALAFSMCEIAFFRCAVITAAGRRWPGILKDGLGTPRGLSVHDRSEVDFLIESDVLSEGEAISWLRQQVTADINVPAFP